MSVHDVTYFQNNRQVKNTRITLEKLITFQSTNEKLKVLCEYNLYPKNITKDQYRAAKEKLPNICPAGFYGQDTHALGTEIGFSRLLVVDIDGFVDLPFKLSELQGLIYAFKSPSNNGWKLIFATDKKNTQERHFLAWWAAYAMLVNKGVPRDNLDTQGQKLNATFYLCYRPRNEIYFNPDVAPITERWNPYLDKEEKEFYDSKVPYPNDFDFQWIKKWLSVLEFIHGVDWCFKTVHKMNPVKAKDRTKESVEDARSFMNDCFNLYYPEDKIKDRLDFLIRFNALIKDDRERKV